MWSLSTLTWMNHRDLVKPGLRLDPLPGWLVILPRDWTYRERSSPLKQIGSPLDCIHTDTPCISITSWRKDPAESTVPTQSHVLWKISICTEIYIDGIDRDCKERSNSLLKITSRKRPIWGYSHWVPISSYPWHISACNLRRTERNRLSCMWDCEMHSPRVPPDIRSGHRWRKRCWIEGDAERCSINGENAAPVEVGERAIWVVHWSDWACRELLSEVWLATMIFRRESIEHDRSCFDHRNRWSHWREGSTDR